LLIYVSELLQLLSFLKTLIVFNLSIYFIFNQGWYPFKTVCVGGAQVRCCDLSSIKKVKYIQVKADKHSKP
jgi:hypothetical protein